MAFHEIDEHGVDVLIAPAIAAEVHADIRPLPLDEGVRHRQFSAKVEPEVRFLVRHISCSFVWFLRGHTALSQVFSLVGGQMQPTG